MNESMSDDDWDDAYEDWPADYSDDDDDELDEEEVMRCPECGADVFLVTDKCNACGYWLTAADQSMLQSSMSQGNGLKRIGKVVIVVILIALMSGVTLLW